MSAATQLVGEATRRGPNSATCHARLCGRDRFGKIVLPIRDAA